MGRTVKGVTQNVKQSALGIFDFHLTMTCSFPKKSRKHFQIFQDLDHVQENFSEVRNMRICCYGIRQMLPLRIIKGPPFQFLSGWL